ncbi:MAG: 16S rRNA (cytidine(1402)-2'-O)-methyltransferase [Clostridia bacterium]|nr:16S rRNA (cytidine(1402)-2'-O)-methyltransferase [Clostridia bacterium]
MALHNKGEEKNRVEAGVLYLVATPIGNLSDISERALKVLAEADFVAAEDTRNTLRLLSHFEISTTLVSYHEHNKHEAGERICERLEAGESCALVTDAGTPGISDPGADLVALCADRGIKVTSVPGACAGIDALILSALPTVRFVFEGFLPMQKKERAERLSQIALEQRTVILHEAPHKLKTTLSDLANTLGGDRRIAVCRELTKLNEEILRITLLDAVELYSEKEPRGEYVLVVEGSSDVANIKNRATETDGMTASAAVAYYEKKGMTKKEAMKRSAEDRGMSRNEFYKILLEE